MDAFTGQMGLTKSIYGKFILYMMRDEYQNDLYTFFKEIDFDWETFIIEPCGGGQI